MLCDLGGFTPAFDRLLILDSDGCVFDSMERKQKRCFHPLIVAHWKLEPLAGLVRETAEFVTLYSAWRGTNRFTALLRIFDLLRARTDAMGRARIPELADLRRFVCGSQPLSNTSLAAAARSGSRELTSVLSWSKAVDRAVAREARHPPPFPGVRKALREMQRCADIVCVSQTPVQSLRREWNHCALSGYVRATGGQEQGRKDQQILAAVLDRYMPQRVLMLGDAMADLEAARARGIRFFPILPGQEASSWQDFLAEILPAFRRGTYTRKREDPRVRAFRARLPSRPPWSTRPGSSGNRD